MATLKPHVSSLGYALFLTVNATAIWGGIFPFLPPEFQTDELTLTFYLAQALAFSGAFLASMLGSYFFPHKARRMLVTLSALLVFAGSACPIGAMYLFDYTLALVASGGILLGIGCAGMFMLWQRYFASLPPKEGSLRLIIGTAVAPLIYFTLYLVPIAVTAFLIPLVFVPLCALCMSLSVREMQIDQPMFEDIPRQHPSVYRHAISDHWRNALCVGAIAFASGVFRGIALLHEEISTTVNIASMLGSLVSAAVLLVLWYRFSFRFSLATVFRIAYPLLLTGFVLLPFLGAEYLNLFAALMYMAFSFILMLMMMQSAQVSRDRGINPVFIYAFFGSVAYLMQSLGFLLGWLSDSATGFGSIFGDNWLYVVAGISEYVIGLTLLAASGTLFKELPGRKAAAAEPIEFLGGGHAARTSADPPHAASAPSAKPAKSKVRRNRPSSSGADGKLRDRFSKLCQQAQLAYGLSMREAEVMELIARGHSVASIAEKLFISENTVRTHSKHIYTKLDIHSKQELLDLLDSLDEGSAVGEDAPDGEQRSTRDIARNEHPET